MPKMKSLKKHLQAMNESSELVVTGKGFFWRKYCSVTCPSAWIKIVYHSFMARYDAKAVVSQSLSGGGLRHLATVDRNVYDTFGATMRLSIGAFLKAVDNSRVQRLMLSLTLVPVGLFRKLTGLKPLGLCFFKHAWKELEDLGDYEQKSGLWWKAVFAGCPDVPAAPSPAFEDEETASKLLGGIVPWQQQGRV